MVIMLLRRQWSWRWHWLLLRVPTEGIHYAWWWNISQPIQQGLHLLAIESYVNGVFCC